MPSACCEVDPILQAALGAGAHPEGAGGGIQRLAVQFQVLDAADEAAD